MPLQDVIESGVCTAVKEKEAGALEYAGGGGVNTAAYFESVHHLANDALVPLVIGRCPAQGFFL